VNRYVALALHLVADYLQPRCKAGKGGKEGTCELLVSQLHKGSFYANFLNRLSVKRIEEDYAGLF
jgi:hypothetical protein